MLGPEGASGLERSTAMDLRPSGRARAVPAAPDAPAAAADSLLLVGHGTRSPAGEAEMHAIARLVAAAAPSVATGLGFLELSDPPAGRALDGLVGGGAARVVVVPLMLFAAGHAKSDLPAVVAEARHRHPGTEIVLGGPLGVARALVEVMGEALGSAGAAGLPLLVVARGTSDPEANGDAAKATRLLAEWAGAPFSHTAFCGVTGPTVAEALDAFARLGHRRMALVFWFLCHGWLVDRARAEVADFSRRRGVEVVDAGYLGPDGRLGPLLAERRHQATGGRSVVNCDTCAYRAPWPGLESRVGQAIGVGHSHLAADHRRSGRG